MDGGPSPCLYGAGSPEREGRGRYAPCSLLLFWAADGLAAGLQVEIDRKGGQCAFHRLFPLYCVSSGCTCDAPKNDAR